MDKKGKLFKHLEENLATVLSITVMLVVVTGMILRRTNPAVNAVLQNYILVKTQILTFLFDW